MPPPGGDLVVHPYGEEEPAEDGDFDFDEDDGSALAPQPAVAETSMDFDQLDTNKDNVISMDEFVAPGLAGEAGADAGAGAGLGGDPFDFDAQDGVFKPNAQSSAASGSSSLGPLSRTSTAASLARPGIHRGGQGRSSRMHDRVRKEKLQASMMHHQTKSELEARTLDSQLLPMWPYPVIVPPVRPTTDEDGFTVSGPPGAALKHPWAVVGKTGKKGVKGPRIAFPFAPKSALSRYTDDEAEDEDDETAPVVGSSKARHCQVYMPTYYFDPMPALETREWVDDGEGGSWTNPWPVGKPMPVSVQIALNWVAREPFRVDKTGKPKVPLDSKKEFRPENYWLEERTMGPCARGQHDGERWRTVTSRAEARRLHNPCVWSDASACARHMLSAIARGEGFAEVLFKSIRVLGGGSDLQVYMDANEPSKNRIFNFQLAVERARSTLSQLSRLSVAADVDARNHDLAKHAHGTIDFEGNTNQAPFLVVELQDFLVDEEEGAKKSPKFSPHEITRMLTMHCGIRPPRLIISLMGATEDSDLDVTPHMRDTLKNGLLEAPDAWVVTSGLNGGVSKLVAEIMSEIRSELSTTSSINADYAVPVIGIVPVSKLVGSESSVEQRDKHERLFSKPGGRYHRYEAKEAEHLNGEHTFFIFVRDSRRSQPAVVRDRFDMSDVTFRRLWLKSLKELPFESIVNWRRIHLAPAPVEASRVQSIGGLNRSKTSQSVQAAGRGALDDENANDHFLEHTTQVATLELCVSGTGDQETDEGFRNLKLLYTAVMHDYLSPVVVMQGSGGFADLVSYAYRFLHDRDPSASGLTARVLDTMCRRVFKVYTGSGGVNSSLVDVCTACSVASKIVNFDLETSDGEDLDRAFLSALTHTMRAEFHEDKIQYIDAAKDADRASAPPDLNDAKIYLNLQYEVQTDDEGRPMFSTDGRGRRVPLFKPTVCEQQTVEFHALERIFDDLVNRYELHLNLLRYAMGFDRPHEAAQEIARLDQVWSDMLFWVEASLNAQFQYEAHTSDEADGGAGGGAGGGDAGGKADSSTDGGDAKTMSTLRAGAIPAVMIRERFHDLFSAAYERQRARVAHDLGFGDDAEEASIGFAGSESADAESRLLILPDHYTLALEYALDTNRVDLVKLFVPKVANSTVLGMDMAAFLYGPSVTRPDDGVGSTLAELYEYEHHPSVRAYLGPILRVNSAAHSSVVGSFLSFLKSKAEETTGLELSDGADADAHMAAQVRNNRRLRKVWGFIEAMLTEDPFCEASTWGGRSYESIFDDDGLTPAELERLQAKGQAVENVDPDGRVIVDSDDQGAGGGLRSLVPSYMLESLQRGTNIGGVIEVKYKPWVSANQERHILLHKDLIATQRRYDVAEAKRQREAEGERNMVTDADMSRSSVGMQDKLATYRSWRRDSLGSGGSAGDLADVGHDEELEFVALSGHLAPKVLDALAKDRTLESMWALVQTKKQADRDLIAYHELLVWAVLMGRRDLAEYFWQMGGLAIPSALIASVLFTGMATHPAVASKGKLADVASGMFESSDVFERHAVGVMDLCYKHDTLLTQEVLEMQLTAFDWLRHGEFDSLSLANLAGNLEFISHPACQAVIERKWKGGKTPMERRENFNAKVPVWRRWREYLFSPRVSFAFDCVVFLLLMALVAAVALEPIRGEFSVLEWIQLTWYSGLVFEELRQLLGVTEGNSRQRFRDALRDYLSEFWNWIDIMTYGLFYCAIAIRFRDLEAEYNQRTSKGLYGLSVCFVYLKVLRYFQIQSELGPKVTIFFTLFHTLLYYLLILAVFITSYGIYVQTILNPYWNYRPFSSSFSSVFWSVLFRPWFTTFGELFLEDMGSELGCTSTNAQFSNCSYGIQLTLPWVLSVFLAITSIMLVNMLIADFTMTFERIHEESTKHWRMGKLSLLDEYENRTFFPPPLNLPWLVWLFLRFLVGKVLPSGDDDTPRTLKAQEHEIIVEIFQDRLCDQYLSECRANVDHDLRLRRIESQLAKAEADVKFFKARNVSSSMRVERKYFEKTVNQAIAEHPFFSGRALGDGGAMRFASVGRTVPSAAPGAKAEYFVVKSPEKHDLKILLGRHSELEVYTSSMQQHSAVDYFVRVLHKGFWQPDVKPLASLVAASYVEARHTDAAPGKAAGGPAVDEDRYELNPFAFDRDMFRQLFKQYSGREFRGKMGDVEAVWNSILSKSAVSEPMRPGCNHLRMHIVTRWKRDSAGMVMEREGFPVLEFVAIKRKSTSRHWSIPEIGSERYRSLPSHTAASILGDIAVAGGGRRQPDAGGANDDGEEQKLYKISPVEHVAFHPANLREGVSKEQATKVAAELRELFGPYREEADESTPGFLFDGFLDDHRNTGISWIRATAFHFHDSRGLTDAWELTYPAAIPGLPAPSEVAWLTVHAHLDLLGEQEDLLEHVALKLHAYW